MAKVIPRHLRQTLANPIPNCNLDVWLDTALNRANLVCIIGVILHAQSGKSPYFLHPPKFSNKISWTFVMVNVLNLRTEST